MGKSSTRRQDMLHMPQCVHLQFRIRKYYIIRVLLVVAWVLFLLRQHMKRLGKMLIGKTYDITHTRKLAIAQSITWSDTSV